MIRIKLKEFPELKGCKRFRTHNKSKERARRRFNDLTLSNEERLEREATELMILTRRLKSVPCEVDIQVGSQEGRCVATGEISPVGGQSQRALQELIPPVIAQAAKIAEQFPGITFLFLFIQSVEFPEIEF